MLSFFNHRIDGKVTILKNSRFLSLSREHDKRSFSIAINTPLSREETRRASNERPVAFHYASSLIALSHFLLCYVIPRIHLSAALKISEHEWRCYTPRTIGRNASDPVGPG